MATKKSAIKAHKQSLKRAAANRSVKSKIKTLSRSVEQAVKQSDTSRATDTLRVAESEIMKGVRKGVLKLNTASRKVSRLARIVKGLDNNNNRASLSS